MAGELAPFTHAAVKSSRGCLIDDLLIEILLRLPLKSLVRFELVSKEWLSLITKTVTPLKNSKQTCTPVGVLFLVLKLFLYDQLPVTEIDYVPFSLDTANQSTSIIPSLETMENINAGYGDITIVHSCNGLLLCQKRSTSMYYVCNPTTNKLSCIPAVDNGLRRERKWMWLAFDPAKSPYYKVVAFKELKESGVEKNIVIQIYIYSSENRRWRRSGQPVTSQSYFFWSDGVYWNGNIHWLLSRPEGGEDCFYLDMGNQMIKAMPSLPESTDLPRHSRYLLESCDHLHFCWIGTLEFNIYELKRDYSEWFIKFRVDLSPLLSWMGATAMTYSEADITLHYVIRGEDENDCFLICENRREEVIRYNIVTKACDMVSGRSKRLGETPRKYQHYYLTTYIESLSSV